MIRIGRVIETQGEFLLVCFSRPEACDSCGMCGSGRNETMVRLRGQAKAGDRVEVDMPDAQVLKVSALAYLLPLAGLLLGLWLGSRLFPAREMLVFLSGLVLMAIFLGIVKLFDRAFAGRPAWQPRVLSVLPPEGGAAAPGSSAMPETTV